MKNEVFKIFDPIGTFRGELRAEPLLKMGCYSNFNGSLMGF